MALDDRKPCSKGTGEPALLRALLDGLAADEIVLGDRYFGSFFMLESLMQRELDGLFRMYQGRKFDFRRGRRLGVEDHLVTWTKPPRPDWMDEETDGPGGRDTPKATAAAELQSHAANDHGIPRGNAASSAGRSGIFAASDASRDCTTGGR
jgi:hypothetical protein